MNLLIVLGALAFLMLVAYRGYSVILFAPVAALGAVLLTDPSLVAPMFSSVFMEKMVGFVKNYFPVFMLGAVFGKVIELSGFSKSIVSAVIGLLGRERAVLSIVVVCAILTYGGVSLFVVVFAVYPFAAEMFRQSGIPKRLIPCTIALGAFTFTMDALPGTPQIQNIIPTTFFKTTTWAAPVARPDRQRVRSRRRPRLYREPAPRCRAGARRGLRHQAAQRAGAVRGREAAQPLDRPLAAGGGRRYELRAHAADPARLRRDARDHARRPKPIVTKIAGGGGDLGGRGRAAARHPDRVRVRLAAGGREVRRRQQGGGRRRAAGLAEHRVRIRLRRRDRAAARLRR